jgi:hypothetical protein
LSTLAASYGSSLTCTNATAGSSTPLPNNVATTSYVLSSIAFGDVISCRFTNTAHPPVLAVTKSADEPHYFKCLEPNRRVVIQLVGEAQ